jgi:hypothetical protein
MSIEYIGTPNPPLSECQVKSVIHGIVDVGDFVVVRQTEEEVGLGLHENENSEEETTTIAVRSNQVYVGFHACHRTQRERILELVSNLLNNEGVTCELEEE